MSRRGFWVLGALALGLSGCADREVASDVGNQAEAKARPTLVIARYHDRDFDVSAFNVVVADKGGYPLLESDAVRFDDSVPGLDEVALTTVHQLAADVQAAGRLAAVAEVDPEPALPNTLVIGEVTAIGSFAGLVAPPLPDGEADSRPLVRQGDTLFFGISHGMPHHVVAWKFARRLQTVFDTAGPGGLPVQDWSNLCGVELTASGSPDTATSIDGRTPQRDYTIRIPGDDARAFLVTIGDEGQEARFTGAAEASAAVKRIWEAIRADRFEYNCAAGFGTQVEGENQCEVREGTCVPKAAYADTATCYFDLSLTVSADFKVVDGTIYGSEEQMQRTRDAVLARLSTSGAQASCEPVIPNYDTPPAGIWDRK